MSFMSATFENSLRTRLEAAAQSGKADLSSAVDQMVYAAASLAKQRVVQAADTVRNTVRGLLQPYGSPVMLGAAAGGYAQPGVYINQTAPEEEETTGGRLLRRMLSKRSAAPQMRGLMDTEERKYGSATFTLSSSNHVEAAGSSSLTDDSHWFVADDFKHEGL